MLYPVSALGCCAIPALRFHFRSSTASDPVRILAIWPGSLATGVVFRLRVKPVQVLIYAILLALVAADNIVAGLTMLSRGEGTQADLIGQISIAFGLALMGFANRAYNHFKRFRVLEPPLTISREHALMLQNLTKELLSSSSDRRAADMMFFQARIAPFVRGHAYYARLFDQSVVLLNASTGDLILADCAAFD